MTDDQPTPVQSPAEALAAIEASRRAVHERVATGGWRGHDDDNAIDEGYLRGDAELKRMYVVEEARGLGLARRILAALEEDARAAGRTRMVLETGDRQPEAVALYTSSGYELSAKFGYYRHHEASLCFAKNL